MKWRRWNYALHRDIGYLCIGLTLIYAVSGIAVNHISNSFNPSYSITRDAGIVPPPGISGDKPGMEYIGTILHTLGEKGAFKNAAMVSPGNLRIFTEGVTIDVELSSGIATIETVKKRPLLFEVNYLHLNKGKGAWTWFADIYAAALLLLALTGLLMIRGKKKRRAVLLTCAGFLFPLFYLLAVH
jgi:hypothetical protein